MTDGYMLDTVLDKVKEIIGIEEFGNTKVDTDTNCQTVLLLKMF